jgi:hypothetical protein
VLSQIKAEAFDLCPIESIGIPNSVLSIGERSFTTCQSLQSFTFESPSKIHSLYSIPSRSCSSIEIPDSVEVLDSEVCVPSRRHLVLTFGGNSRLRDVRLRRAEGLPPRVRHRVFVRLSEATLRSLRLNLPNDDE